MRKLYRKFQSSKVPSLIFVASLRSSGCGVLFLEVDGAVGGALGETALRWGHIRVAIFVSAHIKASDDLIPDASRCITTVGVVEMVTVTAHRVA